MSQQSNHDTVFVNNPIPRIMVLTGGIGSGKSYVSRKLKERGIEVFDCDDSAKRLMRTSEPLKQGLKRLVGNDAYVDGSLNKAAVAKYLLASEANTARLNDVIHPAVARDFLQSGLQWLESAIYFESGFYRRLPKAYVVAVTAPQEVRIARIMERDGISREKALEWINKQWPQEKVVSRSNFVILNDGEADVDAQLDTLLNRTQQ